MMKSNYACLLPALAAGSGGLVLRLLLYRTGFDDRGLLSPANPLHILCWLLAIGLFLFLLLRLRRDGDARVMLPRGLRLVSSAIAAALLAFCTRDFLRDSQGSLQWARVVLCVLTAAANLLGALTDAGRKPGLAMLHAPACLFFATDMLCRYQNWSGNPQLADYSFALTASVCLCLCAYQRLALPVQLENRKACFVYTLMALCLCLYSVVGPEGNTFYLAGVFWALSGLDVTPGEEETDVPS